jgi:CRISPR/Cas system-associated exonuclease Cas4 (RecB family)
MSAATSDRSPEVEAKPSASKLSRYAECPGAFHLEASLPTGESSAAANLGTQVHAHLAGEKVELCEEGAQIAERCHQQYLEIRDRIIGDEPITASVVEERLWFGKDWSGAIDRIDFFGDSALLVDYKTGRLEVDHASENLQLRAYAVLVAEHYKSVRTVYAAVIQPHTGAPHGTMYDEDDLAQAREEITGIIAATLKPDAPRKPSPEACKYCRALAICPEAAGETKALATRSAADVPALPDLELARLLSASIQVEDFISAIKDEAKARLKAGKEVPGWTLIQKKGAVRTDSKALKIRWSELTSEPIPTVTGEPSLMLKKSA